MSTRILTIGPNGGVRTYASTRTLSRALSGNGSSDALRSTISRVTQNVEGGFVGNVFVQRTSYRAG